MNGRSLREVFPELEGQGVYEIEYPATVKMQNEIATHYFDFVVHPIKNENGQTTELMLHVVEITELVLAGKK